MTPLETLRTLGLGSPPPEEARERVYGSVLAVLGGVSVNTAANLPLNAAPSAPGTGLVGAFGSAKSLVVVAGAWLFGGVTGAAVYGVLHPPQVRVIYVEKPALAVLAPPPPPPPSTQPPTQLQAQPPTPLPTPSAAVRPSTISPPGSALAPSVAMPRLGVPEGVASGGVHDSGSDLARERALLDVARADAAQGEPERVLSQIEQHRQRFPKGRLSEEREALAIRALWSLGRRDEARQRAQAFRAAYPNSFLTSALDAALSSQ